MQPPVHFYLPLFHILHLLLCDLNIDSTIMSTVMKSIYHIYEELEMLKSKQFEMPLKGNTLDTVESMNCWTVL